MTAHFNEYRSHDEAPRLVSLPIDRCLDTRGVPRSLDGENAEYCPPSEALELAVDILKAAVFLVAGYCLFVLACHVMQIGGTALRGAW